MRSALRLARVVVLLAAAACSDDPLAGAGQCVADASACFGDADDARHDAGADAGRRGADTDDDAGNVLDGSADASAHVEPRDCTPTELDKADILFVVDDSGSMREEQAALQAQFPKLITTLATGKRSPDDPHPFPPIRDLHLAVVSVDMGLVGITGIQGCAGFGDDGLFQHTPAAGIADCKPSYPSFLAFTADGDTTTTELATDFACIATLGTSGCGFEQQLEAPLKALWPAIDKDPLTGVIHRPNRITFVKDAVGNGAFGHGDQENQGFLRTGADAALLGIVIVSDEEDCSSAITRHFTPNASLDPADPLYQQDLNLRCYYNKQNLYSVQRYVQGYRRLHEGNEQLVVYAAIVGVPPDLVDASARANVRFEDPAARNAYYDKILADPRMIETPDVPTSPGNGNLQPSCVTATGRAYPPVRMVQVAKALGENAIVQSICQDDFGPALDAIIDKFGERLAGACLAQ